MMGHPKMQHKKYERPFRPFDRDRIERERGLLQQFGLRRKKEIWRAQSILRTYRQRARDLQAERDPKKEQILFNTLNALGLKCSKLEDILGIELEHILARRLQSIVVKKGLAKTPKQARQLIVHGHVRIEKRKVLWPSYLVPKAFEDGIEISSPPPAPPKGA